MKTIVTVLKTNLKTNLIILFLVVTALSSCSKDDEPKQQEVIKSADNELISFSFLSAGNSVLSTDIAINIDAVSNSLTANLPVATPVSVLTPTITISLKASISPTGAQDFTNPVTYTVTAEDGTKNEYLVTLKVPSTQKNVLELIVEENPENTLNWDLENTLDSELGNLDGVTINSDGNITGLFLTFKNISELTPAISLLSSLELLALDGNPIVEIPAEIGQLTALKEISIKLTQLLAIPPEIGLLTNLETLLIEENSITTLPPEIGLLKNLSRLDLINNEIITLPPEMGFLSNLNFLAIEESNLLETPASLIYLTEYNNFLFLSALPPTLTITPKDALISIYSANPGNTLDWKVDDFPEVSFDDNGNPIVITMNNKNLTRLLDIIQVFSNLESLNVNSNNLENLPVFIGRISTLTTLTAANNQLTTVPDEFALLENLALLSLTNNPIDNIPQEVCDLQIANGGMLTILTDPSEGCN